MTAPVAAKPASPLLEIAVTLLIPSLILMKLSGPENLGAVYALLLALVFPLGWGVRSLLREGKFNLLAILGIVSLLLTGGIGLLELDTKWLAVKEAAIPGLIGLAVVVRVTPYPLVKALLYNRTVLDIDRVQTELSARGTAPAFEARLRTATWMVAGSFVFSSVMNYFLAKWIVTSPAGSAAFNEELGRLTLLSYPVIALPSMLMMMFVLYYLARGIRQLTGLSLAEVLHGTHR